MAVWCLVFKGCTERSGLKRGENALWNAAGQIDAAMCFENERQITCNASQIGDEKLQRFDSLRIAAIKTGCGNIRWRIKNWRYFVGGADCEIKIAQTATA